MYFQFLNSVPSKPEDNLLKYRNKKNLTGVKFILILILLSFQIYKLNNNNKYA